MVLADYPRPASLYRVEHGARGGGSPYPGDRGRWAAATGNAGHHGERRFRFEGKVGLARRAAPDGSPGQPEAEEEAQDAPPRRRAPPGPTEKEPEGWSAAGAEGDEEADLAGAFGNRNGHDGDDADPAHEKRNAAQGADGQGQHVEDVAQGLEHLLRVTMVKLLPVAGVRRP